MDQLKKDNLHLNTTDKVILYAIYEGLQRVIQLLEALTPQEEATVTLEAPEEATEEPQKSEEIGEVEELRLEDMTVEQLQQIARETVHELPKGFMKLNKTKLIEFIRGE